MTRFDGEVVQTAGTRTSASCYLDNNWFPLWRRSFHAERKQHVALRAVLNSGVPGGDIQHSAGDNGTSATERSAVGDYAVDRLVVLLRVIAPYDFTCGVHSSKDAVPPACEHDTWD